MTVAATLMSLDDFFAYDDGTDTRYEPENGELIAMPTESELNRRIAMALLAYFLQAGLLPQYLTMKTEVTVLGARATVRLPDLMVLSDELAIALQKRPPLHRHHRYAAAPPGSGGRIAGEEK